MAGPSALQGQRVRDIDDVDIFESRLQEKKLLPGERRDKSLATL